MNVDGHPFMVVTLEPDGNRFVGTLAHPRRMTTDGRTFSGISGETISERVTTDAANGTTLRITSSDPAKPGEKQMFDMSLTTANEGWLKISDAPFEPWRLSRVTGSGAAQVWTGWDAKQTYALQEPYLEPNAEMAAIYKADQALRQSLQSFESNAKQLEKDDAKRREQVRALIANGQLRAAEDFRLAAMVFQHGSEPRDYLFAHTLALVALEKGDRSASWIAAASLDRYLRSIDRQQIFGLQFKPGGSDRQPLDDELISDALRRELGIPTLAEQQAQMRTLQRK